MSSYSRYIYFNLNIYYDGQSVTDPNGSSISFRIGREEGGGDATVFLPVFSWAGFIFVINFYTIAIQW